MVSLHFIAILVIASKFIFEENSYYIVFFTSTIYHFLLRYNTASPLNGELKGRLPPSVVNVPVKSDFPVFCVNSTSFSVALLAKVPVATGVPQFVPSALT